MKLLKSFLRVIMFCIVTLIYAYNMDRRLYKVAVNDLTMSEEKNSGISTYFLHLKMKR
ncbi:hypothetical protein Ilyop_1094 [Ilyobacter polytropus DSM 2926]|uniref:Uncharacterized protein n=1 Tax=Ilyobacter polytropus (strain ATCC 51220 / DSM 2926 / LMG 16218 / CuHBu1) TaxID=572544 RepID=E3H7H9_ILYPC|nr:hypothetical protein Ilyop_1094 [Ilyobacter polytropus DSM 2926]